MAMLLVRIISLLHVRFLFVSSRHSPLLIYFLFILFTFLPFFRVSASQSVRPRCTSGNSSKSQNNSKPTQDHKHTTTQPIPSHTRLPFLNHPLSPACPSHSLFPLIVIYFYPPPALLLASSSPPPCPCCTLPFLSSPLSLTTCPVFYLSPWKAIVWVVCCRALSGLTSN